MSSNAQVAGAILSDAELITAARAGDSSAFGQLYERHAGAAWAVARQYTNSQADAEDVVADAFTKVWTVVSGGGGPDVAFRAYLFTVIRRLGMLRVEGGRRVTPTDDAATFEAAFGDQESTENPALAGFERGVVARAFRTLPERWQAALWYTEVESLTPAEIAPLLGLTANGVAALAYRAREGLRQAYLQMHLQQPLDLGCRDVAGKLGAYVRGGLAARETAQVDEHLESCGRCRALVLELGDVSHGMRAVIAPLVLGVLGLGALTHPLPVGGGLAAGVAALGNGSAAAAAGAGAGTGTGASAGAGAGATGAGGAGAVSTGAVATVGPGAAVGAGAGAGAAAGTGALAAVGSVAATGGLAAFLGALPIGIVAAAAAVVVAGVAGIAGLLGVFSSGVPESGPPPEAAAMSTVSPEPTGTASSGLVPTATPTDGPTDSPTIAAAPGPTDVPTDAATPVPTAVPTGVAVAGTGSAVVPAPTSSPTVPAVVDPVPAPVTSGTPVATPPPAPTADPVVPGAPAFQLTTAPLTLAAQAAAQSVSLTVTNTGTADATDLTADVTLPAGAVVTGATTTLTSFVLAGRFEAAAPATDWTCTPGSDPQHATCRLALLASGATSRLTLTVLVGEDQDVSPADSSAISVVIRGLGIEPQTLTAPVTMKPSAARLRLDATPTVEPLVADNVPNAAPTSRGTLHLALSNAGQLAAATPTVTLQLPPRVHVAGASGSWTCTPSWPGGFDVSAEPAGGESVTCTRPQLGGRAADALDLELYAMVGAIQTASPEVSLGLSPDAPQVSQGIRVGLDIRTPAELRVTVPASSAAIDLVAGAPARIPVTVTNVGQTHATDSRVLLTLPAGARWTGPAVVAPGWACVGAGTSREALPTDATIECTTPTIARGAATVLTAGLSSDGSVRGLLPSFRATVQPIGGPDGSSVDVAVTVHASALEVAAAPAIVHAGTFAVGDQASLTFTVANSGNAAATSSSATVTLPTQVAAALDAGSTSGCAAATGGRTVTCDLGALAAGQDTKVQLGVRAVNAGSGDVAVTLSGGNGPAAGDSEPVVVASGGLMPRFSTVGLAGTWNVVEMGAPLLTCTPSAQCSGALTGKGPTLNNNDLTMVALLEKGIADAKVASSAQLHMPAGREVAFAGLYWAASGGSPTTQPVTARLAGPGRGFAAVTGALLAPSGGAAGAHEYQAFADVTAQVRTGGAGAWTFADPSNGVGSGAGAYAGWALVVVYADSSAGAGTVVVHDGAVTVNVGSSASLSVATTPGQTARVGVVAWEGDRGSSGDTLTLDGAPLVPVRWTGSGDAAGDATNAFDSTAVGSDYANSLGVDAKGFLGTVIAAPRAPAVAGSSVLTARSPHEAFVLGVVTVLTR